jgi:hypothetical protein
LRCANHPGTLNGIDAISKMASIEVRPGFGSSLFECAESGNMTVADRPILLKNSLSV